MAKWYVNMKNGTIVMGEWSDFKERFPDTPAKGFRTQHEAETYAAGIDSNSESTSSFAASSYYIALDRSGVYRCNWKQWLAHHGHCPNPRCKKAATLDEAVLYNGTIGGADKLHNLQTKESVCLSRVHLGSTMDSSSGPATSSTSATATSGSTSGACVVIYTDGSCDCNGVGGRVGRGGWAAVAEARDDRVQLPPWEHTKALSAAREYLSSAVGVRFGGSPATTNNVSELRGLRAGLEMAGEYLRAGHSVEVRSDSQYAMGALRTGGNYKANVEDVQAVRQAHSAARAAESGAARLTISHVRAHQGTPGNEAADRLANLGRNVMDGYGSAKY